MPTGKRSLSRRSEIKDYWGDEVKEAELKGEGNTSKKRGNTLKERAILLKG